MKKAINEERIAELDARVKQLEGVHATSCKIIAGLETELDQCLTVHARLNDECEMLRDLSITRFNAGMERAAVICDSLIYDEDRAFAQDAAEDIRKEIK